MIALTICMLLLTVNITSSIPVELTVHDQQQDTKGVPTETTSNENEQVEDDWNTVPIKPTSQDYEVVGNRSRAPKQDDEHVDDDWEAISTKHTVKYHKRFEDDKKILQTEPALQGYGYGKEDRMLVQTEPTLQPLRQTKPTRPTVQYSTRVKDENRAQTELTSQDEEHGEGDKDRGPTEPILHDNDDEHDEEDINKIPTEPTIQGDGHTAGDWNRVPTTSTLQGDEHIEKDRKAVPTQATAQDDGRTTVHRNRVPATSLLLGGEHIEKDRKAVPTQATAQDDVRTTGDRNRVPTTSTLQGDEHIEKDRKAVPTQATAQDKTEEDRRKAVPTQTTGQDEKQAKEDKRKTLPTEPTAQDDKSVEEDRKAKVKDTVKGESPYADFYDMTFWANEGDVLYVDEARHLYTDSDFFDKPFSCDSTHECVRYYGRFSLCTSYQSSDNPLAQAQSQDHPQALALQNFKPTPQRLPLDGDVITPRSDVNPTTTSSDVELPSAAVLPKSRPRPRRPQIPLNKCTCDALFGYFRNKDVCERGPLLGETCSVVRWLCFDPYADCVRDLKKGKGEMTCQCMDGYTQITENGISFCETNRMEDRLGMHLPDLTMDVDTDSGARMPEHIPLPMGSSVTLKVVLPAHGIYHWLRVEQCMVSLMDSFAKSVAGYNIPLIIDGCPRDNQIMVPTNSSWVMEPRSSGMAMALSPIEIQMFGKSTQFYISCRVKICVAGTQRSCLPVDCSGDADMTVNDTTLPPVVIQINPRKPEEVTLDELNMHLEVSRKITVMTGDYYSTSRSNKLSSTSLMLIFIGTIFGIFLLALIIIVIHWNCNSPTASKIQKSVDKLTGVKKDRDNACFVNDDAHCDTTSLDSSQWRERTRQIIPVAGGNGGDLWKDGVRSDDAVEAAGSKDGAGQLAPSDAGEQPPGVVPWIRGTQQLTLGDGVKIRPELKPRRLDMADPCVERSWKKCNKGNKTVSDGSPETSSSKGRLLTKTNDGDDDRDKGEHAWNKVGQMVRKLKQQATNSIKMHPTKKRKRCEIPENINVGVQNRKAVTSDFEQLLPPESARDSICQDQQHEEEAEGTDVHQQQQQPEEIKTNHNQKAVGNNDIGPIGDEQLGACALPVQSPEVEPRTCTPSKQITSHAAGYDTRRQQQVIESPACDRRRHDSDEFIYHNEVVHHWPDDGAGEGAGHRRNTYSTDRTPFTAMRRSQLVVLSPKATFSGNKMNMPV